MTKKPPKWKRLFDVCDDFVNQITQCSDKGAVNIVSNWQRQKHLYAEFRDSGISSSALADGLAQSLRETPQFVQRFAEPDRSLAARALRLALLRHYPEWIESERVQIQKIIDSGSIRSESQFYVIRHQVDLIEGDPLQHDRYAEYLRLLDQYEVKALKAAQAARRRAQANGR